MGRSALILAISMALNTATISASAPYHVPSNQASALSLTVSTDLQSRRFQPAVSPFIRAAATVNQRNATTTVVSSTHATYKMYTVTELYSMVYTTHVYSVTIPKLVTVTSWYTVTVTPHVPNSKSSTVVCNTGVRVVGGLIGGLVIGIVLTLVITTITAAILINKYYKKRERRHQLRYFN